jgi:hypothetical protein
MTNDDKRYHAIMEGWRNGAWGDADSFIAGMAMGSLLIEGDDGTALGKVIDSMLRRAAHTIIPGPGPDLGQYHDFMSEAAKTYRVNQGVAVGNK